MFNILRLLLTLLASLWLATPVIAEQPRAIEGILDLSNWDFEADGNVELRGDYEFYWERFLNRRELLTEQPTQFAEVPQVWNGVFTGEDIAGGHGYATYRLNVLIPEKQHKLALKFLDFGTSARVFVDGNLALQVGHPGTQATTTEGLYTPDVVEFEPQGQRIELVFHVANFNHRQGGIWLPVYLGTPENIRIYADQQIARELLLFGAILMVGLFNIAFFALRPEKYSNLFLSLFCFAAGLRIISVNERFILRIFPDMDWNEVSRVEYLSWYLALPFFLHFLQTQYPREVDRRIVYVLDGITLTAAAIVIATPLAIYSYTVPFMQIVLAGSIALSGYWLLLARRRRREGANLLLFGFVLLMACVLNDILVSIYVLHTPSLAEIGIIAFAVCQSILASYSFAMSSRTMESQFEQLATTSLKLQTQEKLRMEAEMQSRKMTARFRESQQFEALGLLAHGVVSDLKESFDEAAREASQMSDVLKSEPALLATLEKTRRSADRSVAVIEDLLSLSTFDTDSNATDVNEVIGEVLSIQKLKDRAKHCGVILERQLTGSIQAVVGSKLHLQRILENLISNSFDSQPSGGVTTISSEQIYTDGRTLFYDQIDPGYYVIISVEDKGTGIHPEDLDSIFQPFFSRSDFSGPSLGLGMSVVRAIVRQLNGGIDVISEMSQGTRFDIYLPVKLPSR